MNTLYSLFIHAIADWLIFPIVIIGAYTLIRYVPKNQRYQTYARIGMMGLTALLVAKLMALLYQPVSLRPFLEAGVQAGAAYLDNPGFPSDHALFVFAITLAVWVGTKHRTLTTTLLMMSMLVGLGRVLALVHTPIDVMGGILAVTIAGLMWYPRLIFTNKK